MGSGGHVLTLEEMEVDRTMAKEGLGKAESRNSNMMKKKVALRRKIRRESLKGNLCPN